MKKLTLLLISFMLFSCSSHKSQHDNNLNYDGASKDYSCLELPSWFLNMPQEKGIAIGIAATNIWDPESTIFDIKDNASIFASRNKESVVITKLKMRENQIRLTPSLVNFNLQIANDIPGLKKYFDNSEIFHKTKLNGMTIGLVGSKNHDINFDSTLVKTNGAPNWYREDSYYTEDNYLVGCGKSSSVNLKTAYNNAYEQAVFSLIKGVKPKVKSALISSHDFVETFVEVDASIIVNNMKNTRNAIVLRKCTNGHIYDGYVEVKWKSDFQVKCND